MDVDETRMEEFNEVMDDAIDNSRKEKGCLRYDLYQD